MTTAQDGGTVVSLTHRQPLPLGNAPGTHFCQRLSRPQGYFKKIHYIKFILALLVLYPRFQAFEIRILYL